MADIGSIVSNVAPAGASIVQVTVWVLIAFVVIALILGLGYWYLWRKRRWNLKVEIKLTRSDGKITNGEWGQGFYNAKQGVVMIKRPGKGSRAIPMKIFDVRRYMQGSDLISVIQVGPEDYRPILNSSWTTHGVDYYDESKPILDEKGNQELDSQGKPKYEIITVKEAIVDIKTEIGDNKAWRAAYEEAAKQAFTISSFLRQFQTPISIGIVVIACFVGFAILWTKLGVICG